MSLAAQINAGKVPSNDWQTRQLSSAVSCARIFISSGHLGTFLSTPAQAGCGSILA
jgi:hypothetical protein